MKALLLRIGIDKGTDGCLAPIFENGSFETFTYGDPTRVKGRQLARLDPGDLLIFYAGLEPKDRNDISRLFIIGYFTVRHVYDFSKIPKSKHSSILRRLQNNADAKRKYVDEGLVTVEGDPKKSRLLSKAIPLGDARNNVLRDLEHMVGYKGCLLRGVGHWVDEKHSRELKKLLDNGISVLVEDDTHLFSYVLAHDTGFAPNVTSGLCTFACCRPDIRKQTEVGHWLMGTLPKKLGVDRLGYIMRINEILLFDEYSNDNRFQSKKPSSDPNGDNIYYKKKGKFRQLENRHHKRKHLKHDTKTEWVLIGSLFWYFGDRAEEIPCEFRQDLVAPGRCYKRKKNSRLIRDFVSWVSSKYRPGVLGNPRDKCACKCRLRDMVCPPRKQAGR